MISVSDNPRTAKVSVEGWLQDGELFLPSGAGVYEVVLVARRFGIVEIIYPDMHLFLDGCRYVKIGSQYIRKLGESLPASSSPFYPEDMRLSESQCFQIYEEGLFEYSIEEGYGFGYDDGIILSPITFNIVFGKTTKLVLPTFPPPPWKSYINKIRCISKCEGETISTRLKVRFKDGTESWQDTAFWPLGYQQLKGNPIVGWIDGDKLIPVPLQPPTTKLVYRPIAEGASSDDNLKRTIVQLFDLPARINLSVTANGKPQKPMSYASREADGDEPSAFFEISTGKSYLPTGKYTICIYVSGEWTSQAAEIGTSGITEVHIELAANTEVTFIQEPQPTDEKYRSPTWHVYRTTRGAIRTRWLVENLLMLAAGEYLCISDIPGTPEVAFVITEGLAELEVQLPDPSPIQGGSGKLELEFNRAEIAAPYEMQFWCFVLPNRPSQRSIIHNIHADSDSTEAAMFTETSAGAQLQNIPNGQRICILGKCSIGTGEQLIHYSLEPVFIESFESGGAIETRWSRLVRIDESLDLSACRLFESHNVGIKWYECEAPDTYEAPHAPVGRYQVGFCRGRSQLVHREWLDFRLGRTTKLDAETEKLVINNLFGRD